MKTACFIFAILVCFLSAFADPNQICSENDGFETVEEARYALRKGLLEKSKECVPKNTIYGGQSDNEVLGYIIELPNGRYDIHYPPQVAGNTHVEATTPVGAVESMHTHPYSHPDGIFSHTELGPSGQDIATARSTGVPSYALDCASGAVIGRDANGKDYILSCNDQNKTCAAKELSKGIVHKLSYGPDWMGLEKEPRPYSPAIGDKRYEQWQKEQQSVSSVILNSKHTIESPSETVQTGSGILNMDTLRSLADLLETGEDIVEVRQDIREDRAERKAKERAERERQAAEEAERLRQQQLAEQRKKDSQKKNSDQKPASNTKKELAKKTEPKQTNPSTTKPKKTTSATIDTSRLDSAAQRQISYLRSLISAGKPATAAQASTYNSYARATVSEINAITAKINSLSVEYEEKRRIAAQVQSKVDRYSSTISSLKSTARANGILK